MSCKQSYRLKCLESGFLSEAMKIPKYREKIESANGLCEIEKVLQEFVKEVHIHEHYPTSL